VFIFGALVFVNPFYAIPSVALSVLVVIYSEVMQRASIQRMQEQVKEIEKISIRVKSLETKINNAGIFK
jgi:hypothetical protein